MLKCCLLVRYYKCRSCLRRLGCIGTDTLKAVAGKATVEMHDVEQTLRMLTYVNCLTEELLFQYAQVRPALCGQCCNRCCKTSMATMSYSISLHDKMLMTSSNFIAGGIN